MIPEPHEYLSFLMAAPDISDEELSRLGIEILETHGSGIRGLRIPGSGLPGYKALIRERMKRGFWNEMVGRELRAPLLDGALPAQSLSPLVNRGFLLGASTGRSSCLRLAVYQGSELG